MERLKVVFTCVGLRTVGGGGIEAKFTHEDDSVLLRVAMDTHVGIGHKYEMSMRPVDDKQPRAIDERVA